MRNLWPFMFQGRNTAFLQNCIFFNTMFLTTFSMSFVRKLYITWILTHQGICETWPHRCSPKHVEVTALWSFQIFHYPPWTQRVRDHTDCSIRVSQVVEKWPAWIEQWAPVLILHWPIENVASTHISHKCMTSKQLFEICYNTSCMQSFY